jgi:hypothetical protein
VSSIGAINSHRTHGRHAGRRIAGVAIAAIVLVCIALAAPVVAFASRATRGVVVPKLSSGSVTATCPKGEHVSFGGLVAEFKAPPNAPKHPVVFPEGMRRTAPDRWTVFGQSGVPDIGSRLTAIAYCDRGAVPGTASNTVAVAEHRTGSATATCPAGQVVVGGGYNSGASRAHLELMVRLERPTPTQWRVILRNIAPRATKITAIAYCAAGPAPTVYVATVPLGKNKGATARANCPTGTSLVFGGLIANSPRSGIHGADLEAFSWSAATTKQWVVTAFNDGDAGGSLEALAYCR